MKKLLIGLVLGLGCVSLLTSAQLANGPNAAPRAGQVAYTNKVNNFVAAQNFAGTTTMSGSLVTKNPITAQGNISMSTGGTSFQLASKVVDEVFTVSISSGFNTSPTCTVCNSTAAIEITAGATGGTTTGVLTLPTASTGWRCTASNITSNATLTVDQSAFTTASATFTSYGRTTGTATNFNTSDVILISCRGF